MIANTVKEELSQRPGASESPADSSKRLMNPSLISRIHANVTESALLIETSQHHMAGVTQRDRHDYS